MLGLLTLQLNNCTSVMAIAKQFKEHDLSPWHIKESLIAAEMGQRINQVRAGRTAANSPGTHPLLHGFPG